jgi:hypothetical protein
MWLQGDKCGYKVTNVATRHMPGNAASQLLERLRFGAHQQAADTFDCYSLNADTDSST